jgi:histidinol phosphatase-like enzyme (inositol monophosphatase family)
MTSHTTLLAFAHQLADAAGAVIRPCFGAHGVVDAKADSSPVTEADRAAERVMRHLIHQQFPTHHIYGEEFGATNHELRMTNHELTWLLDPIDGTRAFIAGKKEWGTLIALCEDGIPILGILDQPVTGERWSAVRGHKSEYRDPAQGGVKIPLPREGDNLKQATLSTTSIPYFTPEEQAAFARLKAECGEFSEGGDCYAYGLLVRGQRDIVVDAGLKPYDILALVPIIEGAGGVITGWDGNPITLYHYANAVAAQSRDLHHVAMQSLAPSLK